MFSLTCTVLLWLFYFDKSVDSFKIKIFIIYCCNVIHFIESGVESGNNSDSENGNESINLGPSDGSESNSQQLSTSETAQTATYGKDH